VEIRDMPPLPASACGTVKLPISEVAIIAALLVYPAIFFLWRARRFAKEFGTASEQVEVMPAPVLLS